MTYTEWCNQISRELGTKYHKEDVYAIMMMAIRVAMEEFASNPSEARLVVSGVGTFYMNFRAGAYNGMYKFGKGIPKEDRWYVCFKTSRRLRDVVNGKRNLYDMVIGKNYLYPEYHINENGKKVNSLGQESAIQKDRHREPHHSNAYWLKQIKKAQEGKIEVKEDGTIGKVSKRGRPLVKRSISQISSEVRTEMHRNHRRRKRQERDGIRPIDDREWIIEDTGIFGSQSKYRHLWE